MRDEKQVSKAMSLVLRHAPEKAGLTLTEDGWTPLTALASGLSQLGHEVSVEDVQRIVQENDKQRFRISKDGDWIRASQGHSVSVQLDLVACEPPHVLFHGTAVKVLVAIMRDGLKAMGRQHVHLSADEETARRTGMRHGRPAVLRVSANQMRTDGQSFFRSDNGVWLTGDVAPCYLTAPSAVQ